MWRTVLPRVARARAAAASRRGRLLGAATIAWAAISAGTTGGDTLADKAARNPPGVAKIILGSKSQTRQDILRELGFSFDIKPANIDEKAIRCPDPNQLVIKLGIAKAQAILPELKKQYAGLKGKVLLITGDQVVVHEGRILEKPESAEEARMFIRGYGRSPAETVGSVVVTDVMSGKQWRRVDRAKIFYEAIPEAVIDDLIKEGEIFWSAGALRVEDPLVSPYLIRIEGTIDSVMGMKKQDVLDLIKQACG
ncbi:hypothetical protein AAMO2058_000216300 [Amorphochlora amoebiformis]